MGAARWHTHDMTHQPGRIGSQPRVGDQGTVVAGLPRLGPGDLITADLWNALVDATGALTDERAILALATGYALALDDRRWDDLAELFTPDATALYGGVEHVGVAAIVARCRSALETLDASHHLVGTHSVELRGDESTHRCYLQAQHVRNRSHYLVAGQYRDHCVRTEAGWRIARRELHVSWTEGDVKTLRG